MKVNRIYVNNWRNYDMGTAEFAPGINVICGKNAQGKTNLLEAVYMLTGGKSFRTRFDKELIRFDATGGEILADVEAHGRVQTVRILLQRGQRKTITQNGVKKTAMELADSLKAVLFCPDDLNLIRDGAAVRRKLMDNAICQIRPKYAEILSDFNRLYEHKTRILKDWHEKPSLLDTLDEFSDGMARASAQMIRYRAAFAARLKEAAAPYFKFGMAMTGNQASTFAVKSPEMRELLKTETDPNKIARINEILSKKCFSNTSSHSVIPVKFITLFHSTRSS